MQPAVEVRGNAAVAWFIGRTHKFYEDRYRMLCRSVPLVDQHGHGEIFAVADGVSDAERGMAAAQHVCDRLVDYYRDLQEDLTGSSRLGALLSRVNDEVVSWGNDDRGKSLGAAAASIVLLNQTQLTLFHVGDTLAIAIRDGSWWPLSNEPNPTEGLTRYFGASDLTVTPRSWSMQWGDRIVLTTDGLTKVASPNQIAQTADQAPSPMRAAESLARLASARGASDDVTVLVIDVEDDDE